MSPFICSKISRFPLNYKGEPLGIERLAADRLNYGVGVELGGAIVVIPGVPAGNVVVPVG